MKRRRAYRYVLAVAPATPAVEGHDLVEFYLPNGARLSIARYYDRVSVRTDHNPRPGGEWTWSGRKARRVAAAYGVRTNVLDRVAWQ